MGNEKRCGTCEHGSGGYCFQGHSTNLHWSCDDYTPRVDWQAVANWLAQQLAIATSPGTDPEQILNEAKEAVSG